ncbi:MAG: MBL fold metallo-hydrolase [Kofleriaceae bacterium]|nr:MBL fold metallo-hydrolase [Kofleriaceae bacterium]
MRPLAIALVCAAGCSAPGALWPDAGTDAEPDAAPTLERPPLEIVSLGVQGFVLRRGHDTVLTAPMFTRQSMIEVTLDAALSPDTQAIEAGLAGLDLDEVRAVVSGHAHYDHFLDVPEVLQRAPNAIAYTNLSGRHILAALAPDRPAGCTNTPARPLARSRVIALDDPLASYVDYTNCPAQRPDGAPTEGTWLDVPDSHVRILPVCSMHPAQIGPIHFGEGSVDEDQCDLPRAASGWLEGQTLGLVIDFLDDDGTPAYRVFYQDAPTNAPIGHVPAAKLADKPVDVTLLCVGSSDAVTDHPTQILGNTSPRFALSGHWEDFFQPASAAPQPIPLLDVTGYVGRAEAALPGPPDAPLVVDGEARQTRHVLVAPGTRFVVPPAP